MMWYAILDDRLHIGKGLYTTCCGTAATFKQKLYRIDALGPDIKMCLLCLIRFLDDLAVAIEP